MKPAPPKIYGTRALKVGTSWLHNQMLVYNYVGSDLHARVLVQKHTLQAGQQSIVHMLMQTGQRMYTNNISVPSYPWYNQLYTHRLV